MLLNNDVIDLGPYLAATLAPKPIATAADAREDVPIESAKLADYVGVYALNPQLRFTVIQGDPGHLRIRLTGQPFGPVTYLGGERFLIKRVAAEFQFSRNASGQVDKVVLFQRGQQLPATRIAEPVPTVIFLGADKLREYAGTYQLTPSVVFEIAPRGAQLYAKLTGQQSLPVFCDRPDHFVYDVVVAALVFERNAAGAVTAVVLDQNGLHQRAERQPDAHK